MPKNSRTNFLEVCTEKVFNLYILTLSLVSSISPFILLQSSPFPASTLQLGIWIWTRGRSSLILPVVSLTRTPWSLTLSSVYTRVSLSFSLRFTNRNPLSTNFGFFGSLMSDAGRRFCNKHFVYRSLLDNLSADLILLSALSVFEEGVRLTDWWTADLEGLLADW